jgi:predicted nucleic-acid-binding Zn-ribbon protein
MQFSEQAKTEITEALQKKQATKPCARCNGTDFAVLEGFTINSIQSDSDQISESSRIPSAGVVCNKCGNLSFHALGILLT